MPPDDEDRASLVDMLGFAREVVEFSRGRKRADLDRTLRDLKDIKTKCVEHLASVEPVR